MDGTASLISASAKRSVARTAGDRPLGGHKEPVSSADGLVSISILAAQYLPRLSFMRSPGEYSDAPFFEPLDCPTVPLSCIWSPGLFSDAPLLVPDLEFCIS